MPRATEAVAHQEEITYQCDRCATARGVMFADWYWVCALCAQNYFERLEDERRAVPRTGTERKQAA